MNELIDSVGRRLQYLRVSVTDRCNYRCRYCMPEDGITWLPHEEIMSYEEIFELCRIFAGLGMKKVRFTGGEPLLRKGMAPFLSRFISAFPLLRVSVTTNGSLLYSLAEPLIASGIQSINVSLDTLSNERFRNITRNGDLSQVLQGLEVIRGKIRTIKLNSVLYKNINEYDIESLLKYAREMQFILRFIEFMPADIRIWDKNLYISNEYLLSIINNHGSWVQLKKNDDSFSGPAAYYVEENTGQKIGIISAVSHNFCHLCNRLRLSSTGQLYPCLFSSISWDLLTPLRKNDYSTVSDRLIHAVKEKPKGKFFFGDSGLSVSRIGG
ncbi:MAG: GTP 3',8-cyclase MoaA [Smithella sp.]